MPHADNELYEFGKFRLDVKERRLESLNGEISQISIPDKAFQTLVYLVRHPGRLVSKDELMSAVWPETIVEENNLDKAVYFIRQTLGERKGNTKFVETVRGYGYRFVADVSTVREFDSPKRSDRASFGQVIPMSRSGAHSAGLALAENPARDAVLPFPAAEPVPDPKTRPDGFYPTVVPRTKPRRPLYTVAGIAVVGLIAVAGIYFLFGSQTSARSEHSMMAVLPLKPINPENRDPIFEFAIAESLILKLSSDKDLTVRPLSAVRRYIEIDSDPIAAGRELKADLVLSSNYQVVNGKIRVTSQLLNVSTGITEATFKSESDASDAFSMQDAVANDIGNEIFARLGSKRVEYIADRGTKNEEAYRLYLQGHYLVEKLTGPDARRALELFDAAVKLDPDYAQAWAGKAYAHCATANFAGTLPETEFANAKAALQNAFRLNPKLAEANAVQGMISFEYDWDFSASERYIQRAFELDPNHVMARRLHALQLAMLGRYDDALGEITIGIDKNPNSVFHQFGYARILYSARRYDEAIAQIHRVIEMDPGLGWAPHLMWLAYHMKGDTDQAFAWFIRSREKLGTAPAEIELYRNIFQTSGWRAVLQKHAEILRAKYKSDGYDPASYSNLLASTLIGDKDAAFKFANDGVKYRSLWVPFLLDDPAFEPLRGDPRFDELLKRAGLTKL